MMKPFHRAEQITVHKLDPCGKELIRYSGTVLERKPGAVKLEAYFGVEDVRLHGLEINQGDRFVEWYFNDRWYNVYAIVDIKSGVHKGWYCNITRPARIERKHVYAEDLALDLIVFPDGVWIELDRDEFEALGLPEPEVRAAEQALLELIGAVSEFEDQFAPDAELP